MNKSFKNGLIVGIFAIFSIGIGIAAYKAGDITPKTANGMVSFGEFNEIIGTLNGIENDGGVFKTSSGLVIEVRNTDPSTAELEDGRMWILR